MSKIKYPCAMEHKSVAGLVVWFNKENNGTTVQVGTNKDDFLHQVCDVWDMNDFKPYISPKEYEYKFTYLDKHNRDIVKVSRKYYKNLGEYEKEFSSPEIYEFEIIQMTKREVQDER